MDFIQHFYIKLIFNKYAQESNSKWKYKKAI